MIDMDTSDWITLGVGFAALLLASISLIWQAVTWNLTGARVKVKTSHVFLVMEPDLRHAISVEARNVGRSSIEITGWGFKLEDGRSMVVPHPRSWNPAMPMTLEGGHSASWSVPIVDLDTDLTSTGAAQLRGFVNLGTGSQAVGKPITLDTNMILREEQKPRF
jgi:hypothetical protein